MHNSNDFVVKFKGLANGLHQFHYVLGDSFFTSLEDEDLQGGQVDFEVTLDKKDTMLSFQFQFQGIVKTLCDRCLDAFDIPVSGEESLYVKFGNEEVNTQEDIIYLPEQEHKIDLFDYIRQYVIIALPMQRIHPMDENGESLCNKEMLKKLEDIASNHVESNEETNPCWDVLKKLQQED